MYNCNRQQSSSNNHWAIWTTFNWTHFLILHRGWINYFGSMSSFSRTSSRADGKGDEEPEHVLGSSLELSPGEAVSHNDKEGLFFWLWWSATSPPPLPNIALIILDTDTTEIFLLEAVFVGDELELESFARFAQASEITDRKASPTSEKPSAAETSAKWTSISLARDLPSSVVTSLACSRSFLLASRRTGSPLGDKRRKQSAAIRKLDRDDILYTTTKQELQSNFSGGMLSVCKKKKYSR